jgi:fatty-acyl-CoA synthase
MMQATPTLSSLPLRGGDFTSLAQALDYAAQGETGYNFYNGRGKLYGSLTYAELRREARRLARRLLHLGLGTGARVALVAETGADFMRFFFACQYARLVPVPLPVSINLGSHRAYVEQLRGLLQVSQASAAMAPSGSLTYLLDAAEGLNLAFVGDAPAYEALAQSTQPLPAPRPGDLAYLQFTSGSTRFPRGVMITQRTVLANLAGIIRHGVEIRRGDRCVSWLPFYHDMGLVGLVLVPVASQMSVDYLDTRDFAMRPRQWLALISQNRATISFGPPFGYELCARRLRPGEANRFDLSTWRVAGVGAEMIRTGALEKFTQRLAPGGFDPAAFLPCYGMAECSLGVSFSPLNQGLAVDRVDAEHHGREQYALPIAGATGPSGGRINTYVNCGVPLPDYQVEIRDGEGRVLGDRHCGTIFLKGPSVMSGYLGDPEATAAVLDKDGWLDTGDIGYRVGSSLFITGRQKDLVIINGRNVWPQDLEYIAEQQPEVRTGDVLAFSAPGADGEETTVLVVQCRETDPRKCKELTHRLRRLVREELGIDSRVELVPLHTLPRTSSGKLSRSRARLNFIAAQNAAPTAVENTAPSCHHRVA